MYIDTCTFIANRLFHDANVKVSKLNVFHKPGEDYRIVLAKCRKRDFPKVADTLELLPSKALVCGWHGYMGYCNEFLRYTGLEEEPEGDEDDG